VTDAFLLLSFGGPEGPDDVVPFLRNVTRGRGIPDERLKVVGEHYFHFGGVSPINARNRALLAAIESEFGAHDVDLPVYWGNRNWAPYLTDAAAQMAADGVTRAFVLATSSTGGYSACRQYREDLASVDAPIEFVKLRHYYDHPGFVSAYVDGARSALAQLPDARLVFTAHSVPLSQNYASGPSGGLYLAQQRELARLVADQVRGTGAEFDLVWQSRSGPPSVPWLEPDINDHLRTLAAAGTSEVIIVPTGFVSDHMEVLWDLDTEAAATAAELGLRFLRAATAGTHPAFVSAIRELVQEAMTGTVPPNASGWHCPKTCCLGEHDR